MRVRNVAILRLFLVFTFYWNVTPLLAESRLIFPRASFDVNLPLGVAIVNPTAQEADVALIAYGVDGRPLSCEGVTNPVQLKVEAYHQEAWVTSSLFGACIDPSTIAWLEGTSPADGLTGFFLLFSPVQGFLEGTDLPVPAQKLVFNLVRIDEGFTTEIDLVNPGEATAEIQIQLAGISPAPVIKQLSVPGNAVVRLDAASFFQVKDISPGAYVSVDSNVEVAGFELVYGGADGTGLNARSVTEKLSSLYFLHLSVLGGRRSRLGVVNYSSEPVIVTISASKPDGTLYDSNSLKNNPVTRALPAGGSLSEDVESMFGFSGDSPLEGWLTVKATSAAISGYLAYTDESSGAKAVLTCTAQGRLRSLFSHIATAAPYHTHLALLNPGSLPANLRIVALERSGKILGSYDTVLQPGQRFSKQLGGPDLIPAAAGQSGGFIWVKSDLPLYVSCVIGDDFSNTNIPAQEVPESYIPDADLPSLKLAPPIAIVPPGSSQRFQVSGSSSPIWYVNGTAGGAAGTGTISSTGVYTSPKSIPKRQIVTITAEANNQSAGASADILSKSVFASGLSVVQSVAYLGSLRRVYVSELAALSSGPAGQTAPGAAAETEVSRISEVAPTLPALPLFTYSGENIVKILGFTASAGKEYLLLLGQTNGRVIRLNPSTKESLDVVTGLNKPTSMVLDPVSGDLLVAEEDKITTVPRTTLESGLNLGTPAALGDENLEALIHRFPAIEISGAAGIAVDRCTGIIYLSIPGTGSIVGFDPLDGSSRTIVTGLPNPGQLLGLYRTGVTCPDSFHLLVVERDAGRVDLVVPSAGSVTVWQESAGVEDLAFMPIGNPFTSAKEGVLLANYTVQKNGEVFIVPMVELYDNKTVNPPVTAFIDRKTDLVVSQSSSPREAVPGTVVTYTATIANKGPLTATGVILVDTLPSAATLQSVSSSQGNCSPAGVGILCSLGSLASNGEATVAIATSIKGRTPPGSINNVIDVSATEIDPDPSNNHSIETTTVLHATAVGFRINGPTEPVDSGEAFGIVVTAIDKTGNAVPDYAGRVHFTSSDIDASLPGDFTFAASDGGSHAFGGLQLLSSGSQTVTVTETGTAASISGEITIEVEAGSASSVELTGLTARIVAGTPQRLTASFRDSSGNLADSFVGWVSLSSSDPQAVLPEGRFLTSADGGRYTFSGIVLKTAGTQSITITATPEPSPPQAGKGNRAALQAGASIISKVISVEVTPGAASSLAVSPGTTTATAGVAIDLSVTVKDDFGNTVTGYTGTVGATSTDPLATSLVSGYTFTTGASADNGIHSFAIILRTAGSTTITVADTGANAISGTTSPLTVVPGALDHITLSPAASTITTDGSQAYTVTAYDADSNSRGDVTASIIFTISTGGTCTGDSCTSTIASPTPYTVTGTYSGKSAQAALTVEAGALHHLELSPAAASIAAGGIQTYLATGFDQYNNSRGDVTGTTTFSIAPDGSCTLNSCTAAVAGSHTVTGTAGGKTANASLTVAPGALDHITLSPAASTITTDGSQAYTVTAYDAGNNSRGDVTASTTFTITTGGTCTGASCTSTIASPTPYTVTGTYSGKSAQAALTVEAGALHHLELSPAAASIAAGGTQTYLATGFDQYNNSRGDVTGTTTFSIAPDGSCTLNSCTAAVAGSHTITGTAGGKTANASLTVAPGDAVQLIVSAPGSATAGNAFNITATVKDAYSNTVTGYTGTVSVTSSDPQAPLLISAYTFTTGTAADNGIHVFSITLKTAGSITVTLAESITGGLSASTGVTVAPAAAAGFSLSTPASATAGNAFNVTAVSKDSFGNTVPSYTGTVSVTSDDPQAALLISSYTFTTGSAGDNGSHTFGVTLKTAGLRTITVRESVAGGISGVSPGIVISAGPAASLQLTAAATAIAGTPLSITVYAKDTYGNTATGYGGTVHFTSTDSAATLPGDSGLTSGSGSLNFTFRTAGSQTVTAYDTVAQGITGDSNPITVEAGATTALKVSGVGSPINYQTTSNVVVAAFDVYGNVAAGYRGTVHFTSTDSSATLPSDYIFQPADAGVHTFTTLASGTACGNWTVTVTDTVSPAVSGSQTAFVIGPTAGFALTGLPAGTVAGTPLLLTVTAKDACGTTTTGYQGTIAITSSDSQAFVEGIPIIEIPFSYRFTTADLGSHTFNVSLASAGNHTFTATDAGAQFVTGTSQPVNVSPASAAALYVGAQSPYLSGESFPLAVTAYDQYGNVATGYRGTVSLGISDSKACLTGTPPHTFSASDNGSYSFGDLTLITTGSQSVTASDGFLTGTATVSVSVNTAPPLVTTATSTPAVPSGLKITCVDGPDSLTSAPCPVVQWGGYTIWAFSYLDNRFSFGIVGYDCRGNNVLQFELPGARYVWQITVDSQNRTVTFWGQANNTATVPWNSLIVP